MKPYSFDPERDNDVGCCPGHDWPRTYRWAGKHSSPHSMRTASDENKRGKRERRRRDKQRLKDLLND